MSFHFGCPFGMHTCQSYRDVDEMHIQMNLIATLTSFIFNFQAFTFQSHVGWVDNSDTQWITNYPIENLSVKISDEFFLPNPVRWLFAYSSAWCNNPSFSEKATLWLINASLNSFIHSYDNHWSNWDFDAFQILIVPFEVHWRKWWSKWTSDEAMRLRWHKIIPYELLNPHCQKDNVHKWWITWNQN